MKLHSSASSARYLAPRRRLRGPRPTGFRANVDGAQHDKWYDYDTNMYVT